MTPAEFARIDTELNRIRQEIVVISLNMRAEMTAIDLLRTRLRHEQETAGCACLACTRLP
jgi:hypothetical protein